MSVVCTKIYKNKIVIAADSISIRGYTQSTSDFGKLEKINDLIIGGCGLTQEINLLFMFARTHTPLAADEKSVTEFIFEFYKWKNSLGIGFNSENEYLIGYSGKVFYIENMLVKEVKEYQAIGAGADYALSALLLGHSPEEAVTAACKLCCYVSEPIVCLKMEKECEQ